MCFIFELMLHCTYLKHSFLTTSFKSLFLEIIKMMLILPQYLTVIHMPPVLVLLYFMLISRQMNFLVCESTSLVCNFQNCLCSPLQSLVWYLSFLTLLESNRACSNRRELTDVGYSAISQWVSSQFFSMT